MPFQTYGERSILSKPSHLKLPFVVGITGHRRVADRGLLEKDIEKAFIEMAASLPSCHPVLLSALAAGADQIAARVALKLGWELIAVLPFAPDDPRHNFSSDEQEDFQRLLTQASGWVNASAHAVINGAMLGNGASEEDHFVAAGQYIANGSHVLISAWDGVNNDAAGGTADITSYRLNMRPLRIDPLSLEPLLQEWRLVLIIPTRRAGDEDAPSCTAGWYTDWSAVQCGSPDFNDSAKALQPYQALNSSSARIGTDSHSATKIEDELEQLFGSADRFAITHTTWLRRNWRRFTLLSLLALVSAGVYGDLKEYLGTPALVLAVYLLSLFILWLWVKKVGREVGNRQPWDWRLFAEILRVQRVWLTAGHTDAEFSLAPTLGARHHVPSWVIHAYRALSIKASIFQKVEKDKCSRLLEVRHGWVQDQIEYFDKAIRAMRLRKFGRHLSAINLPIGALLAGGCLVMEFVDPNRELLTYTWFAAGLLPGLGAAGLVLSGLHEKAGTSNAALRQREKFIALSEALEGNTDSVQVQYQIAEAGRQAVAEVCVFHENAKLTHSEPEAFLG